MARSPTRSTETSSLGLPKTDKVLSPTRLRRDRPTRLLLCPFRICIPIPPLLTLLLLHLFKPVSWIIHPVVVDGGEDADHGPFIEVGDQAGAMVLGDEIHDGGRKAMLHCHLDPVLHMRDDDEAAQTWRELIVPIHGVHLVLDEVGRFLDLADVMIVRAHPTH